MEKFEHLKNMYLNNKNLFKNVKCPHLCNLYLAFPFSNTLLQLAMGLFKFDILEDMWYVKVSQLASQLPVQSLCFVSFLSGEEKKNQYYGF